MEKKFSSTGLKMLCSKSQYPTSVCHSGINIIKQTFKMLLCENDIASALENTGKL